MLCWAALFAQGGEEHRLAITECMLLCACVRACGACVQGWARAEGGGSDHKCVFHAFWWGCALLCAGAAAVFLLRIISNQPRRCTTKRVLPSVFCTRVQA
jgi:hypothetical protein